MVVPNLPEPVHGFFPAFLAGLLYVGVVVAVSYAVVSGFAALGLRVAPGFVTVVLGVVFVKPFVPVFGRFVPDPPGTE
jgi:hypothetical protein